MSRLFAFLALALPAHAAPPTCPTFAEPGKAAVVATVDGTAITRADADAKVAAALCAQRAEHARKVHELRASAVEALIADRLVAGAAKAAGEKDGDAWMNAQLAAAGGAPGDAEVQAFYAQNQDRMAGKSLEEMRAPITEFLSRQRREAAYNQLIDGLTQKAKVVRSLPPFRMPVEAIGPSKGPAKAPITIVEFADFECGYCGRAQDVVQAVMAKYPGKVRLVFRDFPLDFHANARPAAIAARCAGAQGKYWEMHDLLFQNMQNLSSATYTRLAAELKLDREQLLACLRDPVQAARVAEDHAAGRRAGVDGTPAFFINGVPLSGARPLADFTAIIDAELARTKR